MAVCTVKAPQPPGAPIGSGHSRPILVVKYLGRAETYAAYRDGQYEFELANQLCDALQNGQIEARFQLDDGVPVGIILVGEQF